MRNGVLSLDRFLAQLARRLRIPDADIVTADEVRGWPTGRLDRLLTAGLLQETEPGTTVVCDQCDEHCAIEPQLRTDPQTGKTIGVHICMREGTGGRIIIDLDRLRRWTIDKRELSKLGYTSNKGEGTPRASRKEKKENELFVLRTALDLPYGWWAREPLTEGHLFHRG